eukprot:CAMPEP_0115061282 /NCGR_PEP_ID=MMETSP0227-20121206/7920_1 /TAXON_ID=89957 /ORGANISM="Polarella glacialis, Strain CCMP 1383" /LENGTH=337 /DNA_ID=CAMNT_0002446565 /DNA_START=73 /DNA_END=1086 /DNA_ORIENTATION=-
MIAAVLGTGGLACALHLLWQRFCQKTISVSGKHVFITGGSQGLGRALAEICFQKGARVTIVARTSSKLQQACEEIRKLPAADGASIQYFTLDVSSVKLQQFADLMGKAAETFGRVDVLVANAGTGNGKLLVGTPFEELDELMESQISVNLLGGLRCVTAAAQLMSSDGLGGRISIVSSAAGLISLPGYAIYSATKFGHRGFLAGAYHEFRRHGVHLSVYYPGSIRTPGFQQEQEACPRVTARIEAQCSEISSAESVAAVLLKGIESGAREITNELLPSLVVDSPTGCAPIDALIGAVVQLIRAGWSVYLRIMSNLYIEPIASSSKAAGVKAGDPKRD